MGSLEQLLTPETPEERTERERLTGYLQRVVFAGLQSVEPPFDPKVSYFTLTDFLTVLQRCYQHGVLIVGLEVVDRAGQLHAVEFDEAESSTNGWTNKALEKFGGSDEFLFSATYKRLSDEGKR
jgi:hypothetical protein